MKTFIAKPGITVVPFIALIVLITLSAHFARTVERYQSAVLAHTENVQVIIPGHCYGEVMNNLFAASGR